MFTEHNTNSHVRELTALQPYFDRLLLIPGMEMTTFQGHANALRAEQSTRCVLVSLTKPRVMREYLPQERFRPRDVAMLRRHRESPHANHSAKMLILVAEDEPICALSTIAELEHAGHETLGPARTLEEGLELARAGHPTLALVDIDLACKGDGLELAKRLQEMHIASVFVSAQSRDALEHCSLALGFIGKPYNPADLPPSIDAICAILEGREPPEWPRTLQLFH